MDAEQIKSATRRVERATVRLVKDEVEKATRTPSHTLLLLLIATILGLFMSVVYVMTIGLYV